MNSKYVAVRYLKYFLVALALSPILLCVYLLRPFILIRFGEVRSDRLGHFAVNTALYLCEKRYLKNCKGLDIFYYAKPICNEQLRRMFDRHLLVCPIASYLHKLNQRIFKKTDHTISFPKDTDPNGLLEKTNPVLQWSPQEIKRGLNELKALGLNENDQFICFHARDSKYLSLLHPNRDWSYHDYRDSDISNYLDAVREMTSRGYFAFRMGRDVEARLKTNNSRIIDYANLCRTDFLDIFLLSRCRFYLGSTAGIGGVPRIFHRPLVYVNFVGLSTIACNSRDIFIFKKLWDIKKKRFLRISEIVESKIFWAFTSQQYIENGLEPVENSSQEIFDVVIEMDERLKGTWQNSQEDVELQNRFWSIYFKGREQEKHPTRVGALFLRQNRDLL